MNDVLHERMVALAEEAAGYPFDTQALWRTARRRRSRRLLALTAPLAAVLAGGAFLLNATQDGQAEVLVPAKTSPTPATQQESHAKVPSAENLRREAQQLEPGSTVGAVQSYPAQYLPPGSSAFSGRNRLGRLTASVALARGGGFGVAWDLLDRPLDSTESQQLVDYALTQDESQHPAAPVLLEDAGAGTGREVQVYRIASEQGTRLVAAAWSSEGTTVVLQMPSLADHPLTSDDVALLSEFATRLMEDQ